MKTWYSIQAKAETADISIYDEIGMWGVTAKDFIADLKKNTGKTITVSINSPGGSVFDALAIYNALRSHGSAITTKTMGIAASAASLIFLAGDNRIMPENTFLMVHNPLSMAYGNANEMRDLADTLDKIGASLVATYVARTGLTEQEVKDLLDAETWLNAADALDKGFADEIEPAMKIAASYDTGRLPDNIKAALAPPPVADNIDPPQFADTLTDQIAVLAVAAGFGANLSVWALDSSLTTLDAVKAKIDEAREIRALCITAQKPELTDKFIGARMSLVEARDILFAALTSHDEHTATINAILQHSKPPKSAQQAALKTADIWTARKTRKEK